MHPLTLLRLSGFALVVSLPLGILAGLAHPRSESLVDIVDSTTTPSHLLFALAFALILVGLPGLYAAHADRSGILGLIGFVAMMLFSAYHIYMLLYEAGPVAAMARDPEAERLFAPGGIVQQGTLRAWLSPLGILGPIIYGVALVRACLRPRSSGWLIIAFVPAFVLSAGLIASLPVDSRDVLLNLRFGPIALAISYGLLLLGFAVPGFQLWRGQRLDFDEPARTAAEP